MKLKTLLLNMCEYVCVCVLMEREREREERESLLIYHKTLVL